MIRYVFAGLVLLGTAARADEVAGLCATNPALAPNIIAGVIQAQLAGEHDASLDAEPPDALARDAIGAGVAECVAEMGRDPTLFGVMHGLPTSDRAVGWDAFNTACADRTTTKGACVTAELGATKALNRLIKTNQPAGAKALVLACELVLKPEPAMVEWRECVDLGLAVRASGDAAARCKVSMTWHVAGSGAEAGAALARCLRGSG